MTDEPRLDEDDQDPWLPEAPDDGYGLSIDLVFAIQEALERNESETVRTLVEDVHSADLADLLESLGREERLAFVRIMGNRLDTEALSYLDDSVLADVIGELEPKKLAQSLTELDSDDTVEVLDERSPVFE